jgi:hypothetical protein
LVVEATGRYELELVSAAYDRGIPVVNTKPITVRQFARTTEHWQKAIRLMRGSLPNIGLSYSLEYACRKARIYAFSKT